MPLAALFKAINPFLAPRALARALALAAPLLAVSCGDSDSDSGTTTPTPVAPSPRVEMALMQTLRVEPVDGKVASNTEFGLLSYSASNLGDKSLQFNPTSGQVARVSVSAEGMVSAAQEIAIADFPFVVTVAGVVDGETLASTTLTINVVGGPAPGVPMGDAPSIDITLGQSLTVADPTPGARVGQLAFTVDPAGAVPAFELIGTGADHFAIDSAGNISVASAIAEESFRFELTVRATLPLAANDARASLVLSSLATEPPVTMPPTTPLPPPPPPASASAFAAGAQRTISPPSGAFTEATLPGTCIARFANSAPDNDPCWIRVPVNNRYNNVDYDVRYTLASGDESLFMVADNLLLLKSHLRIEPPADGSDLPGNVTVRLSAQIVGADDPSTIDITLPYTAPTLVFQRQPAYELVPVDDPNWRIGSFGFSIQNGGPHRALVVELEGIGPNFDVRVDGAGDLYVNGPASNLVAGRQYVLTATARIAGYPLAQPLREGTGFTTRPPNLSFDPASYDLLLRPSDNRANALIDLIPATSDPAPAEVGYEIINDAAGNFYAAGDGRIYLAAPLTTSAGATLRAFSGEGDDETSAEANFTVSLATAGFEAVPVDATSDRLNIQFMALLPAGVTGTSYVWEFGDDTDDGSGATTTHRYSQAGVYDVELTVTDSGGGVHQAFHQVYAHQAEDPYKRMQWHLSQAELSPFLGIFSSGQIFDDDDDLLDPEFMTSVYSPENEQGMRVGEHTTGAAGEDIRAIDHLADCGVLDTCRGEGVVVLVADSGVQINHPDLVGNTSRNLSRNLISGAPDIFNPYTEPPESPLDTPPGSGQREYLDRLNGTATHGTSAAGIILAKDANDIGVVGVAPQAELASYNLLDSGVTNLTLAITFGTDHDVGNHSWTNTAENREFVEVLGGTTEDSEEYATTQNRGGLGTVIVRSAGNDGAGDLSNGLVYPDAFGNRHNSGFDGHNAAPETISVAGILASGEENPESEAGANVLISAYWTLPCRYTASREPETLADNLVGIVTTDLTGNFGSSWGANPVFVSALETTSSSFLGASNPLLEAAFTDRSLAAPTVEPLEDMNDYNYCFNGTSGAAPQVSGAAALMLQARPELSWRDVRAILVDTARQNDPTNPGWATNGSGRDVHHHYGYGVVDTAAAVDAADDWALLPDEVEYSTPDDAPRSFTVADCTGSCDEPTSTGMASQDSYTISGQMNFVETVEVEVQILFAAAEGENPEELRGRIGLELEHLDGAGQVQSRTLLHKAHPYLETPGIGGGSINSETGHFEFFWKYLSVQQFGEDSAGTWRLIATDYFEDGSSAEVTWALKLRGHQTP